jgi:hypothetical protein
MNGLSIGWKFLIKAIGGSTQKGRKKKKERRQAGRTGEPFHRSLPFEGILDLFSAENV